MSNLTYAYIHLSSDTTMEREWRVPPGGLSNLMPRQNVKARESLITVDFPSEFRMIDLVDVLGIEPEHVSDYLTRRLNDPLDKGEELAFRRRGLGRVRVKSPIQGKITRIENGVVLIEGPSERRDILAPAPSVVVDVDQRQYVITQTKGVRLQMVWGSGKSIWGTLKVLDEQPAAETLDERFTIDHRGAIIAISSQITEGLLAAAENAGIKGLIAASIPARLAASTEDLTFSIAVSEGFGLYTMSARLVNVLNTYNGREIAMDVDQRSDWRDKPPEIIIPSADQTVSVVNKEHSPAFSKGDTVRLLQTPHYGEFAVIERLPDEMQALESGLWTPGAIVRLPDNKRVFAAFANMAQLD